MRIFRSIVTVFVCLFVLTCTTLFFVLPKKTVLESENRTAATLPTYRFSSLADGTYTAGIEEYTKDHFPARERFMKLKTDAQILFGYKEISDVYIGDDRLFQKPKDPTTNGNGEKFSAGVRRLCENIDTDRVTVTVMLLPTASYVHDEHMPRFAPTLDQKAIIDAILNDTSCENPLNLCDTLIAAKSGGDAAFYDEEDGTPDLYYRTDHHWTSYAAYTAYNAFCDSVGLSHGSLIDYKITTVDSSFRGTLSSRVPTERILSDSIVRFDRIGADESAFTAFFADSVSDIRKGNYTPYSYYCDDALQEKDKYIYFGGGNYPVVVLKNENAATDREIVVAKDSFANSLAPFLTENYATVYLLDCRYLKGKTVGDFVNENPNVTDLLVLYGLNSLSDNSGVGALR